MSIWIEDWVIIHVPFFHDDGEAFYLHGKVKVYGHSEVEDGHYVLSTPIVKVDGEKKEIITQSGSRYKLGQINEIYGKHHPNIESSIWAVAQLFRNLKESIKNA